MFFKKKPLFFDEERWCLGTPLKHNNQEYIPVYKLKLSGLRDGPSLYQGESLFQGILRLKEDKQIWISAGESKLEDVIKHLPVLASQINKEEEEDD